MQASPAEQKKYMDRGLVVAFEVVVKVDEKCRSWKDPGFMGGCLMLDLGGWMLGLYIELVLLNMRDNVSVDITWRESMVRS